MTKSYNDNGCYHYPNATLDLFNIDTILTAQLQHEQAVRLQQSSDYNLLAQIRPKKKQKQSGRLAPVVVIRFVEKHGTPKCIHLLALLDTGCSSTIMKEQFAQKLRRKEQSETEWSTAAGTFSTTGTVKSLIQFPEFSETMTVKSEIHLTKEVSPRYDMVVGRDLMTELGISIDFKDGLIHQGAAQVPMVDMDSLPSIRQSIRSNNGNRSHNSKGRLGRTQPVSRNPVRTNDAQFTTGIKEPPLAREAVERVSQILDAKYAPVTPEQILDNSPHLTEEQKRGLKPILYKHLKLFDGTLGKWKGVQHQLELRDPKLKPFACRPYSVPVKNKATLMLEIKRLCKIGVLRKVNNSEYQSPSTIIPKKDQTVRFITDFRKLNERLKRKPFPLPNIRDTLLELKGFEFGTSLDLNMGYYHIELHPDSRKYCTIVFPFGKYEYLRLPMGLCNSPDIFQEHMSGLMCDLEYVRAYIDDVAILSTTTWEDHLEKVDKVLTRLGTAGLKINGLKSFFGRKEFEYLGYMLTPNGVKPIQKKVKGMLAIAPPKNLKQLRSFLGMVNYYRDMWIRRSHILAPLNALTKKGNKWHWGETEQRAFDNIKRVMAKETLLHYPDFNKPFEIHTDASHYQIGAVITQDNKPVAFYTRKLRDGQHNYTTTERELLAIVETLKEFRTILLGQQIKIYTDHKNLTFSQFNTERVMRWRMVLEEYGPELIYIKGPDNIVADALSRLDLIPEPSDDAPESPTQVLGHELNATKLVNDYMNIYVDELPADAYPLRMPLISNEQRKEKALQDALHKPKSKYTRTEVRGGKRRFDIIEINGKIVVPTSLRKRILHWYHDQLMHPGITRMVKTIRQHFTWPKLEDDVQKLCKTCRTCQLTKKTKKKYGHLPPKEAEVIPWDTLCIDLIGPYTVKEKGKKKWILHCLTMIDPATGWFEIVEIPSKRADDVSNLLEQTWLARYPWPQHVIHDRGREFMAETHQMLINDYGCTINQTTTRNPQANAIVERVHIPGPKEPDREEECPPIYYQTAFKRVLRHLLWMRATRPDEPILVHADDIDAAFRRSR